MKKTTYHRRQIFKDVLVFQVKLVFDALRDFVFSPIALLCGAIDLIYGVKREESLFQKLLKVGVLSDRWINLFGEHTPLEGVAKGNVDQWANDLDRQARKRGSETSK